MVRKNIIITHRYLNGTKKNNIDQKRSMCRYYCCIIFFELHVSMKELYTKMTCLCDTFKFMILLFIELFGELLQSLLHVILYGTIKKIVSLFI